MGFLPSAAERIEVAPLDLLPSGDSDRITIAALLEDVSPSPAECERIASESLVADFSPSPADFEPSAALSVDFLDSAPDFLASSAEEPAVPLAHLRVSSVDDKAVVP